jgi:hypothetical protein
MGQSGLRERANLHPPQLLFAMNRNDQLSEDDVRKLFVKRMTKLGIH